MSSQHASLFIPNIVSHTLPLFKAKLSVTQSTKNRQEKHTNFFLSCTLENREAHLNKDSQNSILT